MVPIIVAAKSPLLAWRGPIYILAGFTGTIAMALLLLQPLVILGYLPGKPPLVGRPLHRWIGMALVVAVGLHVVALWFWL